MSHTRYLDIRPTNTAIATDIAKRWQPRLGLGKALILCDDPVAMKQQVRKSWLHIAHTLQTERSHTIASDRLLRLTHQIIRIQEAAISTKLPQEDPTAMAFCIRPTELAHCAPGEYFSLYITTQLDATATERALSLVPSYGLITCYQPHHTSLLGHDLLPRAGLDEAVERQWQVIETFLHDIDVDIARLSQPSETRADYINEALDILVDSEYVTDFLYLAHLFKSIRQLAEPSTASNSQKRLYDTLIVLARQVQALTPHAWGEQFRAGLDDPMFFLNDPSFDLLGQLASAANMLTAIETPKWSEMATAPCTV